MTFLEAAIEILRDADGPLHFAEVAKRAVEGNLLSHVGRDPEAAMRSCLMSAVRKGHDGADPIVIRDKPGIYGLRPGAELPPRAAKPAAKKAAKKAPAKKAPARVAAIPTPRAAKRDGDDTVVVKHAAVEAQSTAKKTSKKKTSKKAPPRARVPKPGKRRVGRR